MPRIWTALGVFIASSLALSHLTKRRKQRDGAISSATFLILVSGVSHPAHDLASAFNILVNLVCVAMSLDFTYRAHHLLPSHDLSFSRVGYVSSTSAKLLLRSESSNINVTYWSSGLESPLQFEASAIAGGDWTSAVTLDYLTPDTLYQYSSTSGHSGSFRTTRRERDLERFSVVSTSCQKPNWPYSPLSHPLRIVGMEDLDLYLDKTSLEPEMMLFLGDFICELR